MIELKNCTENRQELSNVAHPRIARGRQSGREADKTGEIGAS